MTWTKLGSEWPDEARDLSDAAYRLHVDALCYSNRRGIDLDLPKRDLPRFAEVADAEAAARELVDRGLWEDRRDHWWIGCRFPEWQRTRSQVDGKRKTDAQAQRRKRLHDRGDHTECLPSAKCRKSLSAPDSSSDSAGESEATSARFSERNGTASIGATVHGTSADGWPPVADTSCARRLCADCSGPLRNPLDLADGICVACDNARAKAAS